MHARTLLPLVLSLPMLFACAAETGGAEFIVEGGCLACPEAMSRCRDAVGSLFDRCLATCFGRDCTSCREYDSIRICADVCEDNYYCPRNDFRAVRGPVQPEVAEACRSAFASVTTRCGGTADVAACEHFARIEDPEVIEHYRCYETAPCDALAECEPERDAGRAREVCGALEECGGGCDGELEERLAGDLPWFGKAVQIELEICTLKSCDWGREGCVDAWLEGVYPDEY